MKRRITFPVLIFAFLLGIFSCEDRNPLETCLDETSACGTFTACCTVRQCYYLYNGKKYECDGLDCGSAAAELADDMCNSSKKKGSPCITADEILEAQPCNTY